jgi:hypothetical protein
MAFTGTAAVKKLSETKFKITGLSLALGAAGTICISAATGGSGTAEVDLDAPEVNPRVTVGLQGEELSVPEQCVCSVIMADAATAAIVPPPAAAITGTAKSDFLVTVTNRNSSTATGALVIVVDFGG